MQHMNLVPPFDVEPKHGLVRFEFARWPINRGYELNMSVKVARELADKLNEAADQLDPQG